MTTFKPKGVTNGMSETEMELIRELKEADPDIRLKVAVNLARAGYIEIVGQSGIPGLFEAVSAALSQENNTSFDATRTAAVNIGRIKMD